MLISSNFKSLCIVSYGFPDICFFFVAKFYISNNIWHWLSGSQFLCKFTRLDHSKLWIYWFHLNNLDIFCIFYHCIYKFGFLTFLKFDMNLEDANSLYKPFGCFGDIIKFASFYIDLKCSFLIFLNLFSTVCLIDLLSILGWLAATNGITFLLLSEFGCGPWRFAWKMLLLILCYFLFYVYVLIHLNR